MSKKCKVVIVDDEKLARSDFSDILTKFPNVIVAGEASNIAEAVTVIKTTKPDIVFLDIHLKSENGFDLIDKIDSSINVVFVTAYDQYAIRAFEVNAQDYLLKPVNPERLGKAFEKFEIPVKSEEPAKLEYDDSIFLLLNHNYRFLKINELVAISSAGDYTTLFTIDAKKHISSKSVKEWEERLPERNFCRIHRSTIINLNYVEKVDEWFNHSYSVKIKGIEKPFIMSRNYAARIKKELG